MIDVASLTSQGVQHALFYLDGQPCPTGLNFGEQTGTGVFTLAIAEPPEDLSFCCGNYQISNQAEQTITTLESLQYISVLCSSAGRMQRTGTGFYVCDFIIVLDDSFYLHQSINKSKFSSEWTCIL